MSNKHGDRNNQRDKIAAEHDESHICCTNWMNWLVELGFSSSPDHSLHHHFFCTHFDQKSPSQKVISTVLLWEQRQYHFRWFSSVHPWWVPWLWNHASYCASTRDSTSHSSCGGNAATQAASVSDYSAQPKQKQCINTWWLIPRLGGWVITPNYKWTKPTYPIYNWGYNML